MSDEENERLVRRAPQRPQVWLGEREPASHVAPLQARFPATATKEKDFVIEPRKLLDVRKLR